MKAFDLHSEELREEVARLVAQSAHLREVAKNNEQEMRYIAARLAEIEKEVAEHAVMYGHRVGSCVEWRPGNSAPQRDSSKEIRRVSRVAVHALPANA